MCYTSLPPLKEETIPTRQSMILSTALREPITAACGGVCKQLYATFYLHCQEILAVLYYLLLIVITNLITHNFPLISVSILVPARARCVHGLSRSSHGEAGVASKLKELSRCHERAAKESSRGRARIDPHLSSKHNSCKVMISQVPERRAHDMWSFQTSRTSWLVVFDLRFWFSCLA